MSNATAFTISFLIVAVLTSVVVYSQIGNNSPADAIDGSAIAEDELILVNSPSDGDEYCLGENVPVQWTMPAGADVVRVMVQTPQWLTLILEMPGLRDNQSARVPYSYTWDGTYDESNAWNNQFVEPSGLNQIYIEATMKDGSPMISGKSVGRFALIDCNF